MSGIYKVHGALGSPYSMKVRAAMRAKRLPHVWVPLTADLREPVLSKVKAPVIPVIQTPEGEWTNDSTPFLLGLETEGRALLPEDPVQRFACLLLEDMADEWTMKAMFHYRWAYEEDAEWCANWLMYDSLPNAGREAVEKAAATIRERQISRMPLVGCTPETAPIIETSFARVTACLEDMALGSASFLFGDRPSLADMAFYGQIKVMSYDPTPMAFLRAERPYFYRWLDLADDTSGVEGEWGDTLSEPVKALVAIAGETYLPFLKANSEALEKEEKSFSLTLEGRAYTQGVFKYQKRCLDALREDWARLDEASRETLRPLIGPNAAILG
ncbi:glutathione S-transferase family protein [Henriciella aquimarina]|uniref:glutathione S-transferase family protein n=1 Tax=Henriciella aquimarina TaxID=545261 RepID=UPI000A058A46|nr:glutathione S-transferase family protein [Henriciella aquimarina]